MKTEKLEKMIELILIEITDIKENLKDLSSEFTAFRKEVNSRFINLDNKFQNIYDQVAIHKVIIDRHDYYIEKYENRKT